MLVEIIGASQHSELTKAQVPSASADQHNHFYAYKDTTCSYCLEPAGYLAGLGFGTLHHTQ
jgi:hypothetical protein